MRVRRASLLSTAIVAASLRVLALPAPAGAANAPPPETRAWQTGLLRPDRLQHASLSWTVGLGIGVASREPVAAFAGAATLGLAKEIADRRRTGFDRWDLLADCLGAAAAGAVVTRLRH